MNDLISRSTLIEEITSLSITLNEKQIFSDDAKNTILRIINEQPTAYDVDKVVKELRRVSGNGYRDVDGDYVPSMIETKKAIEIVKQEGDTDNDN